MTRPSIALDPLEPRILFAVAITYTLVEVPLNMRDLNNADQLLAPDAIYQIHRGGRLTRTDLPRIDTAATLGARRINDQGIIIGAETRFIGDSTVSQQVLLGPNGQGIYESRYLYDNTTPADDQPNAAVAINNLGQIFTNGGEDPAVPDLTGDVRLFTLRRHGALSSQSANALLQGGTRTIDEPLDINNAGQLITTDAHYPVDNLVTFRRGVGTLQTAEQLAGGVPAPLQKLNALNDRAQIVGATQQPGPGQQLNATLYQLSRRGRYYRTFLGTLPGDDTSEFLAINNAGQILGTSYSTPAAGPILDLTATITLPNATTGVYRTTQDLNALIPDPGKDRVTRPIAINDAGVILAEGASTRNGSQRFLLLLPSRANRASTLGTTSAAPPAKPSLPANPSRSTPFATSDLLRSDSALF